MNGMIIKSACGLAAAVAFGGAALAQDSSQATDGKPEQEIELPLGEPVGPKLGELYEREQIVDWTIRCIRAETPEAETCQMYQLLKNSDGSGVAEVSLVPLRGDDNVSSVANVVTPLETLLIPGLVLSVDQNDPISYPFTICSQQGCLSRFGITNELLEMMKSGNTALVQISAARAPDRPVFLDVSLSGFTRAFDALIEQDANRPQ